MQMQLPMVHVLKENGTGFILNLGAICCVEYGKYEGKFMFHVSHMGGESVSFEADNLQEGFSKIGISLAGLTIVK